MESNLGLRREDTDVDRVDRDCVRNVLSKPIAEDTAELSLLGLVRCDDPDRVLEGGRGREADFEGQVELRCRKSLGRIGPRLERADLGHALDVKESVG